MASNAQPGTAIAARDSSPVTQFERQLESRAGDIQKVLPAHIKLDAFQRTVLTAVAQNPDLLKADRGSLILSCYRCAQDKLLPDGREAALVTFNTRFKDPDDGQWKSKKLVQFMPMVYGLRKKILQSSEVISLEVSVIYKAELARGTFLYEVGMEPPLRHRPSFDLTAEETTDDQIVGAYSIATMKDGSKSYEVMRRFEIDKVRECSQTGATKDRNGQPRESKGPWADWYGEMAKKTVMRRHAKTLPMSGDVLIDVEVRELETGMSTAAALGSQAPDEPTLITDETDNAPDHDPETGEIIEGDDEQPPEKLPEEAAAEQKPARQRKPRPEPEKAEEPNPPAPPVEEDQSSGALGTAEEAMEAQAEGYLALFAKAGTVIDLDRVHREFVDGSDGWTYDIIQDVEAGYREHSKRLGRAAEARRETADAK